MEQKNMFQTNQQNLPLISDRMIRSLNLQAEGGMLWLEPVERQAFLGFKTSNGRAIRTIVGFNGDCTCDISTIKLYIYGDVVNFWWNLDSKVGEQKSKKPLALWWFMVDISN